MCPSQYYAGLDIHKKTISFCVKKADGSIAEEGVMKSTRSELHRWTGRQAGCAVALEATMFTGLDLRRVGLGRFGDQGCASVSVAGHRGGKEEER